MALANQPAACAQCPAYGRTFGFVPPEGPRDAQFVFVGQGPGETEARNSRPFHPDAPSGWRLTRWMHRAGLQRTEVLIGNVIQCWFPQVVTHGIPKGNQDPTREMIEYCYHAHVASWLLSWDNATQHKYLGTDGEDLRHLYTVGVPATKFLLDLPWDRGADRYNGTTTRRALPPDRWQPPTTGETHV